MSKNPIKAAEFFVLRTPRMPVNKLLALGQSNQQIRETLQNWMAKPEVKEALYLASPSLLERVLESTQQAKNNSKQSTQQPNKQQIKQQKKLEQALLKYMIRMCSRPTPFGLFAGIFCGKVTDQTHMLSHNLSADHRKTRLDVFYLSALKEHFLKSSARSAQLRYYPNSSHYFVGEHCRYIEAYQSDENRQYRLSAIESDEHFAFILNLAKQGWSFNQLTDAFFVHYVQQDPEAQKEDVEEYIQSLIDESILLADIPLPLTGDSPDSALVDTLNSIGEQDTAAQLSDVLQQLQNLDSQQCADVKDYKNIFEQLKPLPVKAQENKLFQTDVYRAFEHCTVDQNQLTRLLKQLKLIQGLGIKRDSLFSQFINKFNQRFEGQFVPLDTLLDEESGISFSNETGYEAPLLAGLQLRKNQSDTQPAKTPSILDVLITQAISLPANAGKSVIELSSKTLAKKLDKPLADTELPASFAATISLYEDQQHQPLVKFNGCYGPSAANLLGRFCHLNNDLKQQVINHLEQESAHSPEVIFAEIVHMPEGRPGNVIARPHLRQYEIVFLADSSLASEYQITLSDLYVWVEQSEVKLWSKRLNKQIIPRLSSAHNYSSRSLSAYRFLSMLQNQSVNIPRFALPDSQAMSSFVPRIMLDNLILSEKTWRIPRKALAELMKNDEINPDKWQHLKNQYQLDDMVSFSMHDNVLQLNLSNPIMLEILLAETRNHTQVELKEALSAQYATPVKSADGNSFANELIIPFLNSGAKVHQHFAFNPLGNMTAKPIKRRFSPGSPWLSLKIYAGNTATDALLAEQLLPLIMANAQDYQKWFFIRYGDPDWHLRLRFYGEPTRLCGQLLPKLNQLFDVMIENGEIHKVELSTYEREVERYGGPESMALTESLFMADSQLVAKTVELELASELGEDLRWRIALLTTDKLLTAFEYTAAEKLNLIAGLRAGFGKEFNESNQLRKQLGAKFKTIENQLMADFEPSPDTQTSETDDDNQQVFALVDGWYQQVKAVIEQLNQLIANKAIKCSKDSLLSSLLHMHNNRMFKAYGREHELVMHDFLRRYYFSQGKRTV